MNEKNVLILTVGLPRSGKSTWARRQGYPIVNPDAIRLALHGGVFSKEAEPMVWVIAKYMVKALFLAGNSTVILDATNTTRKRRDEWESEDWNCVFQEFNVTTTVCIQRAKDTGREELIPVIERMLDNYEKINTEMGVSNES